MKKILIVNDNLDVGGIQKSLLNLLKAEKDRYSITLLLFNKNGKLMREIPAGIKVIYPKKIYQLLGKSKMQLTFSEYIIKGFLVIFSKLFNRRLVMKFIGIGQKKITGYDCVISFSHLSNSKLFTNGSGEFVLDKTICDNKVCFIHCDYLLSGCNTLKNNKTYNEFNKIACCSDSVRKKFILGSKISEYKVFTVENYYDFSILEKSKEYTVDYDNEYINIVTVSRLSFEKGIDIAINVISKYKNIKYYVIGDGPLREGLKKMITDNKYSNIYLLGQMENPYPYMKEADYLLVPSRHEAAPLVFNEAKILNLPIISSNTTSAREMVDSGFVYDNLEDLITKLPKPISKKHTIYLSNERSMMQFKSIVQGECYDG